ncbi:hypothetical protein C8Q74DRAFT_707634 [Fomes fomentarius]|nr:hypothetical protein C8Q74DRAFT_707634 [Fomes fomentarius]
MSSPNNGFPPSRNSSSMCPSHFVSGYTMGDLDEEHRRALACVPEGARPGSGTLARPSNFGNQYAPPFQRQMFPVQGSIPLHMIAVPPQQTLPPEAIPHPRFRAPMWNATLTPGSSLPHATPSQPQPRLALLPQRAYVDGQIIEEQLPVVLFGEVNLRLALEGRAQHTLVDHDRPAWPHPYRTPQKLAIVFCFTGPPSTSDRSDKSMYIARVVYLFCVSDSRRPSRSKWSTL